MIEEPRLLTINRKFERPSRADVEAFRGAQTGNVVDAMNGRGALARVIKPLVEPTETMVGVALTSHSEPGDQLGLFASLDLLEEGDVLVAAGDGYAETAITGDLLMGMARNLGAVGLVTDSAVRDRAGLLAVGLPCYSAGLTPNSPVRTGPGTIGLPVIIGGVRVESGDIVIGDSDGVVIVPRLQISAVLKVLEGVRRAEADLERQVKAGLGVPDFIRRILESERVVEL